LIILGGFREVVNEDITLTNGLVLPIGAKFFIFHSNEHFYVEDEGKLTLVINY
jgi:hypothetical protein